MNLDLLYEWQDHHRKAGALSGLKEKAEKMHLWDRGDSGGDMVRSEVLSTISPDFNRNPLSPESYKAIDEAFNAFRRVVVEAIAKEEATALEEVKRFTIVKQ